VIENPWIEWSKQAPGVENYPIETKQEGSDYSIVQVYAPIHPEQYHAMKCTYWRPFVLAEMPKAPSIEERVKKLEDWKAFMMSQPTVDSVPEPKPDANGWWRIEDRKPLPRRWVILYDDSENITTVAYCQYHGVLELIDGGSSKSHIDQWNMWKEIDMTLPVGKSEDHIGEPC
jgi:hypothetical protein